MPKLHLFALICFCSLTFCFLACGDDDDDSGGGAAPDVDDDLDDDDVNDDLNDDVNDDVNDDINDDADDDTVCDGCWIAGQCYADGDANPDNICEKCDAATTVDAWAAVDNGEPCDDGQWCNGEDTCLDGTCSDHEGNPCEDDGLFCNGGEFCDEAADACGHIGNPCTDDTLFCNGIETCDDGLDECVHSGDPCDDPLICNEQEDDCDSPPTTTTTSTTTTTQEPTTTSTTTTTQEPTTTTLVGTTTQPPTTTTTSTSTTTSTTTTSTTTTSTTTTVVTTTSTTTSTQGDCAGFELRGSSLFNDAIDLCINTSSRVEDYYIEGNWDLFTGRENDSDWYDTFTINIADDIAMTYEAEYSTDEYEYYYFEQGAVYGQMIYWLTSGAKSMIVVISGTIDGQDDVFDVIYLTNQPVDCTDNHSPMLPFEFVAEYTCDTQERLEIYDYNDEGIWQVPMDDCFGILFAFSNADCNWIGGNLFYLYNSEWVGGDPYEEGDWITTGCSWWDSVGFAVGFFYDALGYEATYTYTNKIQDGCGVDSNIVETRINFFEEL